MKEFKSFTNNVFFFEIIEMHINNYLEQNYVVKKKKREQKCLVFKEGNEMNVNCDGR